MPCNTDHMMPHTREIELSKIAYLLDELETGVSVNPRTFNSGMHKSVYNRGISHSKADAMIAKLCGQLQQADVGSLSLEAQVWWRDHQAVDRARLEAELQAKHDAEAKRAAIAKLTTHERKLLGITDDNT